MGALLHLETSHLMHQHLRLVLEASQLFLGGEALGSEYKEIQSAEREASETLTFIAPKVSLEGDQDLHVDSFLSALPFLEVTPFLSIFKAFVRCQSV